LLIKNKNKNKNKNNFGYSICIPTSVPQPYRVKQVVRKNVQSARYASEIVFFFFESAVQGRGTYSGSGHIRQRILYKAAAPPLIIGGGVVLTGGLGEFGNSS